MVEQNDQNLAGRKITKLEPSLMITTDASLLGWGAVSKNETCGGQWTEEEKQQHIDVLELQAICFGLKSLLNNAVDSHIRIISDNTTAVAYINNFGGVKSIDCHKVAKNVWEWAIARVGSD